jgi:hypothetical protein
VLGHQNAEYQQSFLALIEKYGGVNERESGRFPACALWEVIALQSRTSCSLVCHVMLGLYGTVIVRPRADARFLPSSPSKEHTARSFLSGAFTSTPRDGKGGW